VHSLSMYPHTSTALNVGLSAYIQLVEFKKKLAFSIAGSKQAVPSKTQ